MRVLGIDPGSHKTGWGVIDVKGSKLVHVAHGVIKAPEKWPIARRLVRIYKDVSAKACIYTADEVATERQFVGPNVRRDTAIIIGMAHGAALAAATGFGEPHTAYAPSTIKKAVAGSGRADKDTVARFVCSILGLKETPPEDAADALAIAITHANHRREL